jgi:DNA polymerase-3 subunit delta'
MFENIIGHSGTLSTLTQELQQGCFPSAAVLHGPPFCGKLSTALEIARVLTCSATGEWSCGCSACRKQRLLVHPNTLLLGSRYFELEISAAADVLRRVPRRSSQYLFIRAVRKLTRRFDPVIWEGDENKIRPLESALTEVEERLDALADGRVSEEAQELTLAAGTVEAHLEKIQALVPQLARALSSDTVPVGHLRRAAGWLHLTSLTGTGEGGTRKVVIVENADRMYDASSNSLLKLLEEPPPEAHLILTTTRRGSMIPTVVSRLRPYALRERTPGEERQVLERIFQEQAAAYRGLREYFLYRQEVNPQQLELLARRFVEAAGSPDQEGADARGQVPVLDEIGPLLSSRNARSFVISFFDEVLREQLRLLREGTADPWRARRWRRALRTSQEAIESYNQQPALTVESLFYTLRGMR